MKATINRFRFSSSDALPHYYRRHYQSTPNCFLVYIVKVGPRLKQLGDLHEILVVGFLTRSLFSARLKLHG